MRPPSPFQNDSRPASGFTLVELMIVVAIIGVLASIAIVGYSAWVDRARMAELEGYVEEVKNGQESYYSRNSEFLDIADVAGSTEYDPDEPYWTQVLEFSAQVPQGVTIHTDAGDSCSICDDAPDPSGDDIWFAVRGEHEDLDCDVFVSSDLDRPIETSCTD